MIEISVTCPSGHESRPIDAFFGAWHPSDRLTTKWPEWPPASSPVAVHGFNWFIAGSTTRPQRALVHAVNDRGPIAAVGFRGYLLDDSLSTWSDTREIAAYWSDESARVHNGVFAAATVSESGARLDLTVDALGVAPLYYRTIDGVVCFATNPRFLGRASDEVDRFAALGLVHFGYVHGDRSLSEEISRVGPGQSLGWDRTGLQKRQWFDFSALPVGSEPIRKQDLGDIEATFRQAVTRCLKLGGTPLLPLSSGHDSRRILTALQASNVDFNSVTVQVRQKGHRDLDAFWSSRMARDFGFRHEVIPESTPERFAAQDRVRREMLDSEAMQHAWMVPLLDRLPVEPSLVFDGLGGDVLGETGFEVADLHTVPDSEKPSQIARLMVRHGLEAVLAPRWWPSADDLCGEIAAFVERLPLGPNHADLAFLCLRTRRGVAPWSQYMLPAGHLAVYPFLDLDYVRIALKFDPLERLAESLQARCLREFWPQYYRYPGSRSVPTDSAPGDPRPRRLQRRAALRAAVADSSVGAVCPRLTVRGLAVLAAAWLVPAAADRTQGWLAAVLSAVGRYEAQRECWSLKRVATIPES